MALRVLLADRDHNFLELLRAHLAKERITVALAANGLDCVDQLRAFAPDVLVLEPDLLWGGGNGVLATMAGDPELDTIPVIIVCNPENDHGSFSMLEAPQVRDYLIKPLSPQFLVRAIRKIAASPRVLVSADSSLWLG